jgi:hypothetical protein
MHGCRVRSWYGISVGDWSGPLCCTWNLLVSSTSRKLAASTTITSRVSFELTPTGLLPGSSLGELPDWHTGIWTRNYC